jgi:hypothetical protein
MPNCRRSATTVRWSPSRKCNVTRKIRERKMNTLICGSIIMLEIALVFMWGSEVRICTYKWRENIQRIPWTNTIIETTNIHLTNILMRNSLMYLRRRKASHSSVQSETTVFIREQRCTILLRIWEKKSSYRKGYRMMVTLYIPLVNIGLNQKLIFLHCLVRLIQRFKDDLATQNLANI